MVTDMHNYRKLSCGGFEWNRNDRSWYIIPYELNLSLLYKFFKKYKNRNWQLDTEVKEQFVIVQHSHDNIYKHVPYIDFAEDGRLFVYNSNPYLDQALEEFDLAQSLSRVVFFADNYGLRVGPNLTKHIKEQYNSIHKVLLSSQSTIFDKGSRLQTDLSISDLEYFMQSVQADHWVLVTFGNARKENKLVDALQQTNVPGKRSYYQYRDKEKKSVHDFLASDLKSESVVLFVDNTHALGQLSAKLPKSLLKIVYLYSHDTGKKIENM